MIAIRKAEDIYQAEGEIENDKVLHALDAAMISGETEGVVKADDDAELLLVVVPVK